MVTILKLLMFSFALLLLGDKAYAHGTKTPSVRAVGNFTWALQDYMKRHDNIPSFSWRQFNDDMASRYPVVLEHAQVYLDIENRYVFFEKPLKFEISGKTQKFIMMALDAELEGETGSNSNKPRPGRFVYFLDEAGKVSHRRYPETVLQRVFSEKGLNLVDYTKVRDFDPPELHAHSHPRKWTNVIRGANSQNKKHVKGSTSDNKEAGVVEGGINADQDGGVISDSFNIWILLLIIILLFGSVVVGLKIRPK